MSKVDTLDGMFRDMEHGVYDYTVNGECSGCGECCSDLLPISAKEIKIIRRYMKNHHITEEVNRFPYSSFLINAKCPFRSDRDKKCLIYEVRPAICRDFRCDKPRKHLEANKKMYHGRYQTVSMRAVFFGHENWILEEIARALGEDV